MMTMRIVVHEIDAGPKNADGGRTITMSVWPPMEISAIAR